MSKVKLKFSLSTTRLAGFPFGESVYNEQAKNIISFDEKIEIVFPDHIEKVASSFVQGFFSAIVLEIGYKGIEENVTITARSDELAASIRKNIY